MERVKSAKDSCFSNIIVSGTKKRALSKEGSQNYLGNEISFRLFLLLFDQG